MNTSMVLFMLCGGLVGLGLALLVAAAFPPRHVELGDAVARIERRPATSSATTTAPRGSTERLGNWAMKTLPARAWVRTPARELALLRIPLQRFYGEKVTFALVGLVAPPLIVAFFRFIGLDVPFQIPAVASIGLAAVMFFIPNYNAVDDAKKARGEFRRSLGAYIDLVALERLNGSGPRQAMESAAEVGDSWVFTRLAEDLARSRWSGVPPWDSLHTLATDLALPELDDFADIMRMSGEQSTSVYQHLRARAEAMRTAILGDELAQANATGERLSIPGSLLGVIFMALLLAPALLSMSIGS